MKRDPNQPPSRREMTRRELLNYAVTGGLVALCMFLAGDHNTINIGEDAARAIHAIWP